MEEQLDVERKRYTIQYTNPVTPGFFIAVIMAINKIEAKTLFIQQHPGCQIRCMMEDSIKEE